MFPPQQWDNIVNNHDKPLSRSPTHYRLTRLVSNFHRVTVVQSGDLIPAISTVRAREIWLRPSEEIIASGIIYLGPYWRCNIEGDANQVQVQPYAKDEDVRSGVSPTPTAVFIAWPQPLFPLLYSDSESRFCASDLDFIGPCLPNSVR